ncbi:cyclin-dependent protein kinase inhibitor SMR1 [Vitis riparia]|uniref:Cyclin-dependent protein kinase inhibitor SMR1 n=2 Tax=Vitis vinifera TaxID=29760 RepID=A5BYH3_VITVI|nr:cyclin-dependent protein kinase inhibitor SMR1 [Vitis vinifera]XP_034704191.1 cyclin-dependent protein kinase inhibitor SMR1 [Vitis riparia]RVW97743.1 hypothetical protein CK203_028125 [Vitis vinifera]CAN72854.1 hypothetical protein VITISV_043216 [Vitis vinifera]|eukprot:XP_010646585.1 PREDICTED: cyclin-dependent protein kinase inhibitor SMR1 [Vitis vinifera]
MSTDLEFHQASLTPIKIEAPLGSKIESDNAETSPCRTPTSAEHKIPVILTCPPAPRKPRRVVRCKRRIREFDFFEIVNRDEVEEFFRSSLEVGEAKRRCKCK